MNSNSIEMVQYNHAIERCLNKLQDVELYIRTRSRMLMVQSLCYAFYEQGEARALFREINVFDKRMEEEVNALSDLCQEMRKRIDKELA